MTTTRKKNFIFPSRSAPRTTAVHLAGDGIRELNIACSGRDYQLTRRSVAGKDALAGRKNHLLSLPLEQVFIKNISLPPLARKHLQQAIDLQAGFHLPWNKEQSEYTFQVATSTFGSNLLILAAERFDCGRPRAILPAPLALLGLALQQETVRDDQISLLLLPTPDGILSLCLDGLTPVFMRSIPPEEGLPTGITLASQAVYLQSERGSLCPDRIVLFSDDPDLQRQIGDASTAELVVVSPAEMVGDGVPAEEAADWLLPLGLALLPRVCKKYRQWNLYQNPRRSRAAIQKRLAVLVLLLISLVFGYFYDEFHFQQERLAGIEGRLRTLDRRHRDVQRLEGEVRNLKDFLSGSGQALISARTWQETVDMLGRHRPSGLNITALTGKLDGEIQVSGTAESFAQVTEYARNLNEERRLSEATLLFTQGQGDDGVTFQLRCRRELESG